ncbi:putative inositol 3-alpha-galactosyltransferase [Helianthus anomalus]
MLPDVPMDHRQKLLLQGCIIREIEPLYPPENQTQSIRLLWLIMLLITPSSIIRGNLLFILLSLF